MKRKIAILLSAMMVTTALPITASAATLTGGSNPARYSVKSGEPIQLKKDVLSKINKTATSDIKTLEDAKNFQAYREGLVTFNIKNDGTSGDISDITKTKGNNTFNIKLVNGRFPSNSIGTGSSTEFDYVGFMRTADGSAVENKTPGYEEDGTTTVSEYLFEATGLSKFNVTGFTTTSTELAGETNIEFGKSYNLVTAIANDNDVNTLVSKLLTDLNASVDGILGGSIVAGNLSSLTAIPETPIKIQDLNKEIPYTIEILDETNAVVTLPLAITNSDSETDMGQYKVKFEFGKGTGTAFEALIAGDAVGTITQVKISLDKVNKKEKQKPVIAIPFGAVEASGEGDVEVVVSNNEIITEGNYRIASSVDSLSTSVTVSEPKSFNGSGEISTITIEEKLANTIGKKQNDGTITANIRLRLNSGYRFDTSESGAEAYFEKAFGVNNNIKGKIDILTPKSDETILSRDGSYADFTISFAKTNSTAPVSFNISKLAITADRDVYGDVKLSVSGDGISSETHTVAKSGDYNFTLATKEDPKEIVSGRYFDGTHGTNNEEDNMTVKVSFTEEVANSFVHSRDLRFVLPDGVKFAHDTSGVSGLKITNIRNASELSSDGKEFKVEMSGTTKGQELVLKGDTIKGNTSDSEKISFDMELTLSVDAGFTGDITLGVEGAGQSADATKPVVIAKAVQPFKVTTLPTDINIGYQGYRTADIQIVENRAGMFLANGSVNLSINAPYGTQELGFSKAEIEVSGSELSIGDKSFTVGKDNKGTINFNIEKPTNDKPATITIKNVEIGTTRSVPFGTYDLHIGGTAIINNTDTINEDRREVTVPTNTALVNETAYYVSEDYINVITATDTLDKEVKVTINEKTILIDGKTIDMDVAPYIQPSSDSTMVPLRFVATALLGVDANSEKISWDDNSKTVTIYQGTGTNQKIIQLQAGSNIMTIDGTKVAMENGVVAEIKEGRTFVPFRAIGQALGVRVDWDADTRTAIYNQKSATATTTQTTESTTESTTEETTEMTTEKK